MEKALSKIFTSAVVVVLVFQLSGCGTIFYPERRGQRGGHLDAGVVILDGVGLLFFLIPGIIAFAVDFSAKANPSFFGARTNHLIQIGKCTAANK